jgi:serine protease
MTGWPVDALAATDDAWFLEAIRVPRYPAPPRIDDPIVIAIVDDGMRITHRDLRDFIWTNALETPGDRIDDDGNGYVDDVHGWDVSDRDGDVTPPESREDLYHGTHVAGIVAQIAREAYGESASRLIRIMPIKALADGSTTAHLLDAYRGIEYAIQAGADIVICAWGEGQITRRESAILQHAAEEGVLVVASGGNWPEEREQFPAAHRAVLAVTSIDRSGQISANANFGQFIDLAAPGERIRSASHLTDNAYTVLDGTSAATAMVASAAALVELRHPSYSRKEVEACLMSASEPMEPPRRDYSAKLGAGRLDAEAAVDCSLLGDGTEAANRLVHAKGFLYAEHRRARTVSWTIEPPGEFRGLRFTPVFDRETAARGRIEFRSSAAKDAEIIANYSLDALPPTIYVPHTAAHVRFEATNSRRDFEFLMAYEAEPIDFSKLYCSGVEELSVEGTLTDGSGADDYSPRTDCRWLITAPEGKVVHFRFDELDTESRTDMIFFFNGSAALQENAMAIFSGNELPPELTTWSNQVMVWFVANETKQGKGWRAEYRFEER